MASFLATLAGAVLPAPVSSFLSSYYSSSTPEPFSDPTIAQVTEIQALLMSLPRAGLPVELANMILEFAEYWPTTTTSVDLELMVFAGFSPTPMTFLYVETPPLGVHDGQGEIYGKIRKVRFTTLSKDQGFADNKDVHGTYQGAHSWFEASILRRTELRVLNDDGNVMEMSPSETLLESAGQPVNMFQMFPPSPVEESTRIYGEQCNIVNLEPRLLAKGWKFVRKDAVSSDANGTQRQDVVSWLLQRNVVAGRALKEHVVEWSIDDEEEVESDWPQNGAGTGKGFIKNLRVGDRIGVWARALVSFLLLSDYLLIV
jgi:hypothetical protein